MLVVNVGKANLSFIAYVYQVHGLTLAASNESSNIDENVYFQ